MMGSKKSIRGGGDRRLFCLDLGVNVAHGLSFWHLSWHKILLVLREGLWGLWRISTKMTIGQFFSISFDQFVIYMYFK